MHKSGRHFWAIWGNCGAFWVIVGQLWITLGHSWVIVGHFGPFGLLWAILVHFWPFLGHFVAFMENFFAGSLESLDSLLECMAKR